MVRSYQAIWGEFQALFPELSRTIQKWKGTNFKLRMISLRTTEGKILRFQYFNDNAWFLYQSPRNWRDQFPGGKK